MKFERCDRRITLERMEKSRDPVSGQALLTVAESSTVWAEFRPNPGSERFAADREISRGVAVFVIRYRSGIDGSLWRIRDWQDRLWDIIGEPATIGRRAGLSILAELRI